jgi:hypothetical protein
MPHYGEHIGTFPVECLEKIGADETAPPQDEDRAAQGLNHRAVHELISISE